MAQVNEDMRLSALAAIKEAFVEVGTPDFDQTWVCRMAAALHRRIEARGINMSQSDLDRFIGEAFSRYQKDVSAALNRGMLGGIDEVSVGYEGETDLGPCEIHGTLELDVPLEAGIFRYCGTIPDDDWVKRVERLNEKIDQLFAELYAHGYLP